MIWCETNIYIYIYARIKANAERQKLNCFK